MKVYDRLKNGTIEEARYAVSMIVGRDTQALSEIGVTKAAVETVAEIPLTELLPYALYGNRRHSLMFCTRASTLWILCLDIKTINICILEDVQPDLTMWRIIFQPEFPVG